MNAYILSDSEYANEAFDRLYALVSNHLEQRGFSVSHKAIGRAELAFCKGCFGCWVKTPGECVISDKMGQINRGYINSDVVVYLSPIVFGQYSANLKNVIDRWIPNVLPFFITRPDGSTMHPPRYEQYPCQIVIGYGARDEEDEQLFCDVSKKHRGGIQVLLDQGDGEAMLRALGEIKLEKAGGLL